MIDRLPPELIFEIGKTVIDSDNELDMKENKNIIVFCRAAMCQDIEKFCYMKRLG